VSNDVYADRGTDIEAFVYDLLAEHFDVPVADVSPTTDLFGLGIDSLGAVEMGLELNREYGVTISPGDIPVEFTVAAIVDLARSRLAEQRGGAP
jgi:acyl carrier protein